MTRKNREYWNKTSDAYQDAHGRALSETPLAWGVWQISEADLGVLGDVEGREVLELGCGAAQWTIALTAAGARVVGMDLSEQQLNHARSVCRKTDSIVRLVNADAEGLPFPDNSFDIVFCDHGATVFAPPERTIPEASRVLREGGLLAFCMSSPIRDICWDGQRDRISEELQRDYFDLDAIEDGDQVCYQLPYGAWIRLFRQNGFEVEDLIELRVPEGATTTFSDFAPSTWARRWPAENIWKLRKRTTEQSNPAGGP